MIRKTIIAVMVAVSVCLPATGSSIGHPDKQSKIIPDECCTSASWDVDTASDQ